MPTQRAECRWKARRKRRFCTKGKKKKSEAAQPRPLLYAGEDK
jgi:hypothetical protein